MYNVMAFVLYRVCTSVTELVRSVYLVQKIQALQCILRCPNVTYELLMSKLFTSE